MDAEATLKAAQAAEKAAKVASAEALRNFMISQQRTFNSIFTAEALRRPTVVEYKFNIEAIKENLKPKAQRENVKGEPKRVGRPQRVLNAAVINKIEQKSALRAEVDAKIGQKAKLAQKANLGVQQKRQGQQPLRKKIKLDDDEAFQPSKIEKRHSETSLDSGVSMSPVASSSQPRNNRKAKKVQLEEELPKIVVIRTTQYELHCKLEKEKQANINNRRSKRARKVKGKGNYDEDEIHVEIYQKTEITDQNEFLYQFGLRRVEPEDSEDNKEADSDAPEVSSGDKEIAIEA